VYRLVFVLAFFANLASAATIDLSGSVIDPFASSARARVFVFVRTDCPITNRYAPELTHLVQRFPHARVDWWLVYADPDESPRHIRDHVAEYGFPGTPIRDPQQELVGRSHVNVAPEAAVFDASGRLMYHGRIDDRWIDFGKARNSVQTHDLETAIAAVLAGTAVPQPKTRAVGCSLADLK